MGCEAKFKEEIKRIKKENPELAENEMVDEAIEQLKRMSYSELQRAYIEARYEITHKINALGLRIDGAPVELVNINVDGKGTEEGFEVNYRHSAGGKVYKARTTNYGVATNGKRFSLGRDTSFEMTTMALRELYSSYDDAYMDDSKMVQTAIENVNDPEQMGKLAEELAEMSDVSEEYKADMKEVMSVLVNPLKNYIPDTQIWLDKEADRNSGRLLLDGEQLAIQIAVGPGNVGKSALELFVHEVGHAALHEAIDRKDAVTGPTVNRLQELRKQFMDEVMKNPQILGEDADEVMETLKYVSDAKVGMHEFVSYVLSNPDTIRVLKSLKPLKREEEYPNLFSKLVGLVKQLMDIVTNAIRREKSDISGHTLAMKLVQELLEANHKAVNAKRDNARAKIVKAFTTVENAFKDRVEATAAKIRAKEYKPTDPNAPMWQKVKDAARIAALATVDDRYRNIIARSTDIAGDMKGLGWLLAPENSFRSALSAIADGDNTTDVVEKLMMHAANIQQRKEDIFTGTAHDLQDGFSRKLSKKEEVFLTSVLLDTDSQSVLIGMTDDQIKDMMYNEKKLNEKIEELDTELEGLVNKDEYNYANAQVPGLGKYLITDKGHPGQLLNAWNIARMAHTSKESDTPRVMKAVEIIDKLATLHAFKELGQEKRTKLAEMMEEESNGIQQMIAYQAMNVTKSRYELFNGPGDKARELKGYTKQLYDKHTDIQIAPVDKESEMRKLGFVKVADLKKHSADVSRLQMAVYKSNVKIQQNLNRVTLMYNGIHRRGTSFTEARAMSGESFKATAEVKALKNKVREEADKMMSTGVSPTVDEDVTVLPIYNELGKIKDFKYVATKATKENLLGMDRRAIPIVSKGAAAIYEKSIAGSYNDQVMDVIEMDAKNYNPKLGTMGMNNKTYIMVDGKSDHPTVKDLWKVLPQEIKVKYPDGFPVRRDMLHWYLGQRDYSVADSKLVQMMPDISIRAIRIAEQIWKDIVKLVKVDIVIRTPIVLVQNVITNLMLSATMDGDFGANVVKIAKMQLQGVQELNNYLKDKKELMRLERKVESGRSDTNDKINMERLRNNLRTNSVDPLIDEGFYTSIVEDLGLTEYGINDTMTGRTLLKVEEKLPQLVRTGLDWAYMSTANPVFRFMQAATVYSDFVARYAHYNLRMEQKSKYDENLKRKELMLRREYAEAKPEKKAELQVMLNDLAKEKAMDYKKKVVKEVREAFVNYNKPVGFEYANQMGMIMFTKWYFNIQRMVRNLIKGHPLKAALSLIAQDMVLGIDIETIEDNAMVERMVKDDSWSKVFGVSMKNPLAILEDSIHPHGIELGRDIMKALTLTKG